MEKDIKRKYKHRHTMKNRGHCYEKVKSYRIGFVFFSYQPIVGILLLEIIINRMQI